MHHGDRARSLAVLAGGALLALVLGSEARAGEWEAVRESYGNALKANDKRLQEIEAKERGISDQQQRAEKITRDKIAASRAALKGGDRGRSLAEAAEKASGDPRALSDLSREQGKYVDASTSDWGADGPERKRFRDNAAAAQKNLERVSAGLTRATKALESVRSTEALEKARRIEASVNEAADRLRARWQLEQAARERESKQREREAAERVRSSGTR
jgi:hypothetical protein